MEYLGYAVLLWFWINLSRPDNGKNKDLDFWMLAVLGLIILFFAFKILSNQPSAVSGLGRFLLVRKTTSM